MDLVIQLGFILAILTYGVFLSRLVSERFHFIANILAASISIIAALLLGLKFSDIGLGINYLLSGLIVVVIASVAIFLGVILISKIKFAKKYFQKSHSILLSSPSKFAYEAGIRIPISTALTEEILFRGVLLGVMLQYHSILESIIISSLVFGLWHIFPALNTANRGYYLELRQGTILNKIFHVATDVLATATAGLFFGWLRILSGSILAPWLVHWSINSSALLSAFLASKERKPN